MARNRKAPAEGDAPKDRASQDLAAQEVAKAVISDVVQPAPEAQDTTKQTGADDSLAATPPASDQEAASTDDAKQSSQGAAAQPQEDGGRADVAPVPEAGPAKHSGERQAAPELRRFTAKSDILHDQEPFKPGEELLLNGAQHAALHRHVQEPWEDGRPE